jgi:hypothetical protein
MRAAATLLVLSAVIAPPARAQQAPSCEEEIDRIVATVTAAIEGYRDPAVAARDGFRPVAHDFPGMGEHWLNLRRAVRDEFDPTRPPILLYARRAGEPVLVGAAFIAMRDPGEPLPGPVFLRHAWHDHSGPLDDELFAGDHTEQPDPDRFAVMVLHVWTRPPSGGGVFDVQNWDLPLLRAGLPSRSPELEAARALSLATSTDYYRTVFLRAGVPPDERPMLNAMLDDARREVVSLIDASAATTNELSDVWRRLEERVIGRWPVTRAAVTRLTVSPRVHPSCADA